MITPPATLGILGGGQLGRYFVMAARTMGYSTIVLEPDPHAPAGRVADEHLVAAYDDDAALRHLAAACEWSPPSSKTLPRRHGCSQSHRGPPSPAAVGIAQDRRLEKAFLRDAGVPIAPFVVIETDDDIAMPATSLPSHP